MIIRVLSAFLFLMVFSAPVLADDGAMGQAESAASQPATSALTNERASGEAATTFDGTSAPSSTPDASAGVDLQPQPFSASPNN